jgi:hypothetical protein
VETLKPYQALAGFRKDFVRTAGVEPAQPCGRGKDPRNYMVLIGLRSRPIRALKGPSALIFNGLTGLGISKRRANRAASAVLRRSKRRRDLGSFA